MTRYAVIAFVAVALLIVGINSYLVRFFTTLGIVFMAALGSYLGVATLTLKKTNIWVYSVVYFLLLIFMLFFRERYDSPQFQKPIAVDVYFKTLFGRQEHYLGLFGNMILFLPMGVTVGELPLKRKEKIFLLVGVMLLLVPAIELTQYLTRAGVFDFADIFWNWVSVALGGVYSLLWRKKKKKQPDGLA